LQMLGFDWARWCLERHCFFHNWNRDGAVCTTGLASKLFYTTTSLNAKPVVQTAPSRFQL
jgi:hypothetical protein